VSGGSSVSVRRFARSHQASKVGIVKFAEVMEHSIAGGDNSIMDEAFNGKLSCSGSYHSSGHGAHSHI